MSDYGMSAAQRDYDNTGWNGTNMTLRMEYAMQSARQEAFETLLNEIKEELADSGFAPSLEDVQVAFPNATINDLYKIHDSMAIRIADRKEDSIRVS